MTILIPITVLVLGVALSIALAFFVAGSKRRLRIIAISISIGLVLIIETIATAHILTQHQTSFLAASDPELSQITPPPMMTEIDAASTPAHTLEQALETAQAPVVQEVQPTGKPTLSADEQPLDATEVSVPPTSTVVVTDTPEQMMRRLSAAEEALRSGELSAVADLGQGTEAQAAMRFDLGTSPSEARFHILTTYRSELSSQVIEYVAIGDKHWQRIDDGAWTELASGHGARENIQSYLPLAHRATGLVDYDAGRLHWNDTLLGNDVVVTLDSVTGVPLTMQRHTQASGLQVNVVYVGWNTPVDIAVPVAP